MIPPCLRARVALVIPWNHGGFESATPGLRRSLQRVAALSPRVRAYSLGTSPHGVESPLSIRWTIALYRKIACLSNTASWPLVLLHSAQVSLTMGLAPGRPEP